LKTLLDLRAAASRLGKSPEYESHRHDTDMFPGSRSGPSPTPAATLGIGIRGKVSEPRARHLPPRRRSIGAHRRTPTRAAAFYCEICARDASGRIARNPAAKREFRLANPCPATGKTSGACPGYVIDHIVALKSGAPDHLDNMQWQLTEEAKAKDRIE
jgi:hypothetical protein